MISKNVIVGGVCFAVAVAAPVTKKECSTVVVRVSVTSLMAIHMLDICFAVGDKVNTEENHQTKVVVEIVGVVDTVVGTVVGTVVDTVVGVVELGNNSLRVDRVLWVPFLLRLVVLNTLMVVDMIGEEERIGAIEKMKRTRVHF